MNSEDRNENRLEENKLSLQVEELLSYYQISKKFEIFRESFKETQNFYLNYFYFFFGEHHESIINNVNFFHYATEAIILEILKKKNREEVIGTKLNFDEMTDLLRSAEIDQQSYYENLKLLTGSSYLYDPTSKISEMKIASEFLKNFILYKTQYFSEEEIKEKKENEEEQMKFDSIFSWIFRMAASATISELGLLSNAEEVAKDLLFNCYSSLAKSKNVILMNFIKSVEKSLATDEKRMQIMKQPHILEIVKIYYFFSKTNFLDYTKDLELFNSHSASLFEKITKVSLNNYTNFQSNLDTCLQNSKTFTNLKQFYKGITLKFDKTNTLVKSKFFEFKFWINESIKSSPNFFYEKYSFSKLFLYNRIVTPSKNLVVLYTDKYATFLMTNLKNVKKTMDEISHYFLDKADIFMANLETKINEKDLCVRFTSDENVNYIKIDLDNTVMMINPKKFKEYAESVCRQMSEYSFEFYEKSKSYLISKYKLFLGEDEKNMSD